MPFYKLGPILQQRRQELGYTQEELADGICAVNTLSRYENGERIPRKEHLEMLMQRLGYSDAMLDTYVDEKTFYLHELKYQIRQAVILHQPGRAKKLLDEFEKSAEKESRISQQFRILYRTILSAEDMTAEQRLSSLKSALQLTCPSYEQRKLPIVLSFEEILILNNIAIAHFDLGDLNTAIEILYQIRRYYDIGGINQEETLRTEPMILYNLSKFLGCAARYDECIEVCNAGIRVARETSRCSHLAWSLYNKAWALSRRNSPGDREAAKETLQLARHMAIAMDQPEQVRHFDRFARQTFGEDY